MERKEELLAAIKKAMQGEMDSVTLYTGAAAHSADPELNEFFRQRSEEEQSHYNHLLQYHQDIAQDKCLPASDLAKPPLAKAHPIFSNEFLKRIGSDQLLFSAISTALLLERDAFEHYHKCSLQTDNPLLQEFFQSLEQWEIRHYDELLQIQKEAELFYWEQNRFEPF